MDAPRVNPLLQCRLLAIVFVAWTWLGVSGCSVFHSSEEAGTPQWSDTLGSGMRGMPANAATAGAPRKEPFWEKWRDKRVDQINHNLSVQEPAGW